MKKRFWTRLISAVVTMAMAFSILAVPASAAQPGWVLKSEDDGTEIYITDLCIKATADREITAAQLAQIKQVYMTYVGAQEYYEPVPEDAALGIKGDTDQEIYWFTAEQVKQGMAQQIPGLSEIPGIDDIVTSSGSTGNASVSSGSSDGGAVAILAIGGAALAAATGLYLYTHPAVIQEVKDFFHDLSAGIQEKIQNLIPASDVEEAPAA